jgi:hypothetical protein
MFEPLANRVRRPPKFLRAISVSGSVIVTPPSIKRST